MSPAGPGARLAVECFRVRRAAHFDPRLAVHLARAEALPHQVHAVYERMLAPRPLRFLLADDPGAGKTVMAGLLMTELRARGRLARCVVVAPGSLVQQWRAELFERFDLEFAVAESAAQLQDPAWFDANPYVVLRLDQAKRHTGGPLAARTWDLAIFDEAHRLAASFDKDKLDETGRYKFAAMLAPKAQSMLLMSATPHSGRDENFYAFLALLDPVRFLGKHRPGAHEPNIGDLILRRLKEDLRRYDGSRLFPPRSARTLRFALSPDEKVLYEAVTSYVREEYKRAQAAKKQNSVGFALAVLQRRVASSPEAILRSLEARHARITQRLRGQGDNDPAYEGDEDLFDDADGDDEAQKEALGATADVDPANLRRELARLDELVELARGVRAQGLDCKRDRVRELLASPEMTRPDGRRRKLVVFTEHRDTLVYVKGFLGDYRGRPECVVSIDGSMDTSQRRRAQQAFTDGDEVEFLVATDAAGEGINLQCASLVLNWDLPWNPSRMEQRFGRVHRIGQREPCLLWNLVATGTRETAVFDVLCERLETESQSLGGQVFDVLGAAFDDVPLDALLREAVLSEPPDPARFERVVQGRVQKALEDQRALTQRTGPLREGEGGRGVAAERASMERFAARRFGPGAVREWLFAAGSVLGCKFDPLGGGRWACMNVAPAWRARAERMPARVESLGFEPVPAGARPRGKHTVLSEAHPWAHGLAAAAMERLAGGAGATARGVYVDPYDAGTQGWWLLAVSQELVDATGSVVDEGAWLVGADDAGGAWVLDGPVHLDLRPATEDELRATGAGAGPGDAERAALGAARARVLDPWGQSAREAHRARLARAQRERLGRLASEASYARQRAAEQRKRGARGETGARELEREANDLVQRQFALDRESAELRRVEAREPVVSAALRVIPAGALGAVGKVGAGAASDDARAVACVLRAQRLLGRAVEDVRTARRGWDLEGEDEAGAWRAWVVRAVREGQEWVTLRRSEATALAGGGTAGGDAASVRLVLVELDGSDRAGIPVEVQGAVTTLPAFGEYEVRVRVR